MKNSLLGLLMHAIGIFFLAVGVTAATGADMSHSFAGALGLWFGVRSVMVAAETGRPDKTAQAED